MNLKDVSQLRKHNVDGTHMSGPRAAQNKMLQTLRARLRTRHYLRQNAARPSDLLERTSCWWHWSPRGYLGVCGGASSLWNLEGGSEQQPKQWQNSDRENWQAWMKNNNSMNKEEPVITGMLLTWVRASGSCIHGDKKYERRNRSQRNTDLNYDLDVMSLKLLWAPNIRIHTPNEY